MRLEITSSWTEVVDMFACAYVCAYELYAYGVAYEDIGMRVRTAGGSIKIGAESIQPSHKLRIRKGGTTYGIPLLSTGDGDASPIRIYDGSTIKALPKVD